MTPAQRRAQLALLFSAVAVLAISSGVHESIFNNFLDDTFAIDAQQRGFLELPREAPGFLVVLLAGMLAMLPETRIAVVGGLTLAGGMIGMAFFGTDYLPMICLMVLGSAGMHLLQPLVPSIAIALSDPANRGRRLGQVGAVSQAGFMVGGGLVILTFSESFRPYRTGFLMVAAAAAAGSLLYGLMHIPHLQKRKPRLIFRGKYWLFYLLNFFFGARKQIFITFGPWVLIRVYGRSPETIATLFVIASFIGIFFRPLAGIVIDRIGERRVMIADGIVLAGVCIGYGYAGFFAGETGLAPLIACGCFILDDMLFALGTARAVYLSRMTDSPQEITSTLAMGVTINHLASMTAPFFAGGIWLAFGHQRLFLGAAGLALCISAISFLVPKHLAPEKGDGHE
jgi:MFS family permease